MDELQKLIDKGFNDHYTRTLKGVIVMALSAITNLVILAAFFVFLYGVIIWSGEVVKLSVQMWVVSFSVSVIFAVIRHYDREAYFSKD